MFEGNSKEKILYINKEKSTAWFGDATNVEPNLTNSNETVGTPSGSIQMDVYPRLKRALSEYILSDRIKDVKTEEDLAALKAENPYMYQQGFTAKGAISVNERNERLIQLFTEGADQSTFIHEMGHMFLMDLQTIAGIDPNSQQAKDLKTILSWAEYKPGQAEDYKGTASYEVIRYGENGVSYYSGPS